MHGSLLKHLNPNRLILSLGWFLMKIMMFVYKTVCAGNSVVFLGVYLSILLTDKNVPLPLIFSSNTLKKKMCHVDSVAVLLSLCVCCCCLLGFYDVHVVLTLSM